MKGSKRLLAMDAMYTQHAQVLSCLLLQMMMGFEVGQHSSCGCSCSHRHHPDELSWLSVAVMMHRACSAQLAD